MTLIFDPVHVSKLVFVPKPVKKRYSDSISGEDLHRRINMMDSSNDTDRRVLQRHFGAAPDPSLSLSGTQYSSKRGSGILTDSLLGKACLLAASRVDLRARDVKIDFTGPAKHSSPETPCRAA